MNTSPMSAIPTRKGVVGRTTGDANAAIAGAAKVIGSEFTTDYVYHAQMEPHVCVASVTPERRRGVDRHAVADPAVAEAAKAAGTRRTRSRCTRCRWAAFGRNVFVEYVIDAVKLSKAAGKPVKMIQSRSDDVVHGRFRPMYAQRIEVGLDAGGKVVGWRHRIAADTVVPYLYGQARMERRRASITSCSPAPTSRTTTCPRMSPITSTRSAACAPRRGAASAPAPPISRSKR